MDGGWKTCIRRGILKKVPENSTALFNKKPESPSNFSGGFIIRVGAGFILRNQGFRRIKPAPTISGSRIILPVFLLLFFFLFGPLQNPVHGRSYLSFSIGTRGGWPEPVWCASDLAVLVKRIEKEQEKWFEESKKSGKLNNPPPVKSFPHWARCQEIALKNNHRMLIVRANLSGLKAAIAALKGKFTTDLEDSLAGDFPFRFDADDWASAILSDFRLAGYSKKEKIRILSSEANRVREVFSDLRDAINRDVVWEHNALENARRGKDPSAVNQAAWRLWLTMGTPENF